MTMKCCDIQTACREALVNYACCEDAPEALAFWDAPQDIIDEYEVCLDVAEFSKGSREMSWAEFCAYKRELRKFVASLRLVSHGGRTNAMCCSSGSMSRTGEAVS